MLLKDRVAIVTGASSGIGRVIAAFYLAEGAKVIGCGLEDEFDLMNDNFKYIKANICEFNQAQLVMKRCVEEFGYVDILVNCAGITGIGDIYSTSIDEFKRQFEINVFGLYTMTKACISEIEKSDHASIINIVSELGVKAVAQRVAYCPSKSAVEMLTRCLAIDCGPRVRVNGILPGLTETPMTKERFINDKDPDTVRRQVAERYVLKRMCTPEDVANSAVFLGSDKSSFITGDMIAVCGGGHFTTC